MTTDPLSIGHILTLVTSNSPPVLSLRHASRAPALRGKRGLLICTLHVVEC